MLEPIIIVNNLVFRYDETQSQPTIDQMTLNVSKGEWLAIIGHNGSGKSTLAKLIDGLLEAESGTITVSGITLDEETVWDVRRHIGLVFQNPDNQFVGATVEDDIAFGLENIGLPRDEMIQRVNWALEKVGMSHMKEKEPSNLSGGQKQRVAIAGVLALKPSVIILDESTSMLDPDGRREVMQLMHQIKEEQEITVISITHDIEEASSADRILVIKEGKIIQEGSPKEIFSLGNYLIEVGLDVPFSMRLIHALKEQGIPMPEGYQSEIELEEWLCKLNLNK